VAPVVALLQPIIGAPTYDIAQAFPTFDSSSGIYEAASGDRYYYPFGRQVCLADVLCLYFGGASADALAFTGYYYYDQRALLFDANGLGVSSRAADWPGAFTYTAGGCYSSSYGTSATDITVGIHSRGIDFGTIEGAAFYPPETDVYVDGFYSGVSIAPADGVDC
jgi:hypothetical protein